jgi:hypothetical protein
MSSNYAVLWGLAVVMRIVEGHADQTCPASPVLFLRISVASLFVNEEKGETLMIYLGSASLKLVLLISMPWQAFVGVSDL